MNRTRNIRETQQEEFEQQREEVDKYWVLRELPETPTKIVEAFKKALLSIDVLKNKNALLFISDVMDISVEEISILKPIFYGIRDRNEPYKIVWIPIVEHSTDDMQAKFEMLQSNMPWYILQRFPPTVADIQIVTNEYRSLKNKPIVVVINPQAKVEHPNALRMIRLCGMKAFPFTAEAEKAIMPKGIHYKSKGSTSQTVARGRITRITLSSAIYGIANTSLENLASNSGWVELCKGTHGEIVVKDQGTTILKVLEKFDDWKNSVNQFGFDECFEDYYMRRLPGN
ncbi:protein SIEVE ELEMENT OCCLUSION B-like [Juglans microcarpa x Juglans regia]|uniref:protein SIEVE ELEMENT OCCLUSION B-like n=1 Tax=Juglans microcarpa x Juglans regia TaxID=2249226 RepID=UPI001B7E8871|nr:protein SIEVE ELEMENT OCCLUSION B-like [Juglans microcarpa x Juglans regia]